LSLSDIYKPSLTKVFQEGETRIYKNSRSLPRAFLVGKVISGQEKQTIITTMMNPSFNPAAMAMVEGDVSVPESFLSGDKVNVTSYTASSMTLSVNTSSERYLVISNAYDACWKATVDDVPAEIFRTDYAFSGLAVPVGEHKVRLSCRI
jgi:hypothetical protein